MSARSIVLEGALRDLRAWVSHWEKDRLGNLPPTESSLRDALNIINHALEVSARCSAIIQESKLSPPSLYALAAE